MAKCLVGAAGGLSAADKAKLIPENLRDGLKLFEGTSREVVGTLYTGLPLSNRIGDSVTSGDRGFIKTNDEKTVFSCYRWPSSYTGWVVIGLTESSVRGDIASSNYNVQYYSTNYEGVTLYFAQLANSYAWGTGAVATINGKTVKVAIWDGSSNGDYALKNVDEVLRIAKAMLTA